MQSRWGRLAVLGWFGAITVGLCACSRPRQPDDARTTGQSKDVVDYSLTQHGQNQPDRTACPGGRCGDGAWHALAPGPLVPGKCDVDLCEGELTPAAITELRASAEKANDCYERELKTQNQLEGKMLVRLRLAAGREPCDVRIEQSSVKGSEDFNHCVLDRLRRTAARPSSECVDVALPLSFVRKEVDASPDAGPAAAPAQAPR